MRIKTKDDRRVRIQLRQRKRIAGTKERPRLSVFRSVTHIYAQVIDDLTGETLVSASTVEPSVKGALDKAARGGNLKGAEAIGKVIAERSIEKGITRVVFDRSGFLYHGRIRAVADAARKAGLEF
jgi:large subunit ribosomal protein L18